MCSGTLGRSSGSKGPNFHSAKMATIPQFRSLLVEGAPVMKPVTPKQANKYHS